MRYVKTLHCREQIHFIIFSEIKKCVHGNIEVHLLHVAAYFSRYLLWDNEEYYRKIAGLQL